MTRLPIIFLCRAVLSLATLLFWTTAGHAQTWRFDVPRQPADSGIAAFSRQAATVQLLVAQEALRGRRTNRVKGNYSIEIALTALLRGSGLRWRRTGPTTYSLLTAPAGEGAR